MSLSFGGLGWLLGSTIWRYVDLKGEHVARVEKRLDFDNRGDDVSPDRSSPCNRIAYLWIARAVRHKGHSRSFQKLVFDALFQSLRRNLAHRPSVQGMAPSISISEIVDHNPTSPHSGADGAAARAMSIASMALLRVTYPPAISNSMACPLTESGTLARSAWRSRIA